MRLLQISLLVPFLAACGLRYTDLAPVEPAAQIVLKTEDQAEISLYHYPGRKPRKAPIVLIPEIGTNHLLFDLPSSGGLAPFLFRKGCDVWVLEFRGSGLNRKSSWIKETAWGWNLDELLHFDLPAALAHVVQETGAAGLHLIGLGLGGTLVLEYLSSVPDPGSGKISVKKAVLINSPGSLRAANRTVTFLAEKARGLEGSTPPPRIDLKESCRILAPWPSSRESLFHLLFWGPIEDGELEAEVCRLVLESISFSLARQLSRWVETGKLTSRDGRIAYLENLDKIRVPVLFLSGQLDNLFPTWQVDDALQQVASEEKEIRIFGRVNLYRKEYGHLDIILGRDAYLEIYPYILRWLRD